MPVECTPEDVGLDSARLDRIKTMIDQYVAEGELPHGAAIVARKGKICWHKSSGFMRVEDKTPLPDDAIFRIYSMSKPLTSCCLMTLWEEGRFQLTEPLCKYLPEFAKENLRVFTGGYRTMPDGSEEFNSEPCLSDITIHQLMTHMSGLSYGFDMNGRINAVDYMYHLRGVGSDGTQPEGPDKTLAEFCRGLAKLPLVCQPGTQWNYSLSVEVQGRLIETLTGMSFYEALRQRVLAPLGMTDTSFRVPHDKLHRFCDLYFPNPKLDSPDGPEKLVNFTKDQQHCYVDGANGKPVQPIFEGGGGGLCSTIMDYYRFANMLAHGGVHPPTGHRILSRKTLQYMTVNHLPGGVDLAAISSPQYSEIAAAGAGFGLGFYTIMDPTRQGLSASVGTFGWGGAAMTYFWVDPEEEIVGVWMTQLLGNAAHNRNSRYYGPKGVPARARVQQAVYSSIADGTMRTKQLPAPPAAAKL